LGPFVVGAVIPFVIRGGNGAPGGWWNLGWAVAGAGAVIYALCLLKFLGSGGTPAIFFTRRLKIVMGEEPGMLVTGGLYRVSRNPMYIGVLLVVFGQAIVLASPRVAAYGLVVLVFFHFVIVLAEEPHLRKERGASFDEYCRRVPRWLGWSRRAH
jgi:protein-S-isoprenylcysteine O-methyltransferase Ste14